jgi:hypothetical protein
MLLKCLVTLTSRTFLFFFTFSFINYLVTLQSDHMEGDATADLLS